MGHSVLDPCPLRLSALPPSVGPGAALLPAPESGYAHRQPGAGRDPSGGDAGFSTPGVVALRGQVSRRFRGCPGCRVAAQGRGPSLPLRMDLRAACCPHTRRRRHRAAPCVGCRLCRRLRSAPLMVGCCPPWLSPLVRLLVPRVRPVCWPVQPPHPWPPHPPPGHPLQRSGPGSLCPFGGALPPSPPCPPRRRWRGRGEFTPQPP
mmetsp:Transcript_59363/g.121602  ORF Transcript_59363/g.121602 Transcript_59363/m.121602 type:complete len:205 (+) Transcript_59363:1789-2403(+)